MNIEWFLQNCILFSFLYICNIINMCIFNGSEFFWETFSEGLMDGKPIFPSIQYSDVCMFCLKNGTNSKKYKIVHQHTLVWFLQCRWRRTLWPGCGCSWFLCLPAVSPFRPCYTRTTTLWTKASSWLWAGHSLECFLPR